jgi:hypothetical protein
MFGNRMSITLATAVLLLSDFSIGTARAIAVAPLNPTRPLLGQGSNRVPAVRARSSSSHAPRTAARENDRLLNHGVTSICRGC